ncbi:MAG: hypothetical protein ABSB35_35600 [Bryobacteraceae bacterium]
MGAVSQWEREAIGEWTRHALRHKRGKGECVGNIEFGHRLAADGLHLETDPRGAELANHCQRSLFNRVVASARLQRHSTEAATARGGVHCGAWSLWLG